MEAAALTFTATTSNGDAFEAAQYGAPKMVNIEHIDKNHSVPYDDFYLELQRTSHAGALNSTRFTAQPL